MRLLAIGLLTALLGPARSPAAPPPFAEFHLGGGVEALALSEGAMVVKDAPSGSPVLRIDWASGHPVPGRGRPAFVATASEGDRGGRRGFNRPDDDGDGRIDEDRLDGIDDDGDGLVDEDHAAIGHAMAVWHLARPGSSRHVEAYHWTYPTVATSVALTVQSTGASADDPVRLSLPRGGAWSPIQDVCAGHHEGGPMYVSAVPGQGGRAWVGVVVLDPRPRSGRGERVRVEGGAVAFPPLEGGLDLVVSWGATRSQVIDDLLGASGLRDGVTDPVTGGSVPWVPRPPAPPSSTTALVRALGPDVFQLRLPARDGAELRLDPDLLRAPDRHLDVRGLAWLPTDGEPRSTGWGPGRGAMPPCRPYRPLAMDGPGDLLLTLAGSPPSEGEPLTGRTIEGLPVCLLVAPDPQRPTGPAADRAGAAGPDGPRLSPGLLTNHPNPFRDMTRITFRVPATVGEAFDLDLRSDDARPDLAPDRPVPYAADPPHVEVVIYGLGGRIVSALSSGSLPPGVYEASWDGRDASGRLVPSGTYFCKLQIESQAVTKRLVFIR